MIEVLVLVLFVILFFSGIFFYSSYRERIVFENAQREVISAQEKIKIAERKFMQGKIKKNVFEAILDELEEELISAELIVFRLKNSSSLSIGDKANQVIAKLDKPTKYRKTKIEKILKETELLRNEMSILEGRFLKHQIKQSVFEKLVQAKESMMIIKEKELMDIVIKGSDEKKAFAKETKEE
ncbi:MAG: hypothetical protein WC821_03110 [archaeon]|jgi:hypothetical protein